MSHGDFEDTKEILFCIQSISEEDDGNGGTIVSYHNLFTPISLTNQSSFYRGDSDGFYYSIAWEYIYPFLNIGSKYNYVLAYQIDNNNYTEEIEVLYGGPTPDDAIYNGQLDQTDSINEQTEAILDQTEAIHEQTEAIEDINNTINDSSVDSGASDLPSVDVNDPTQNGIDNIFQSIYNAFCTGQAQDIVFPIPFTNKNITLNPYYVRDMLNNNGATWIYTLIQAFWGYIIGRYIVKDISKKITKIKGGNIENIENENIKEDML